MLVELTVMEQRYQAVLEVLVQGATVTDVARRYGVHRKSVHAWIRRYRTGGVAALADRSHRPERHPRQIAAEVEALICELRRAHPSWGPRRLVHELVRRKPQQAASRSSVYRLLVRNGLVDGRSRKRRREDYIAWEREAPMQLWQMDIMSGVLLADGKSLKLVSGIDDHSRFCVIAKLVPRETGRAVCLALAEALREFGVPHEILTDNGVQFTGAYARPRPHEVLFERILRENGITHRRTPVRTPTTTGKVERIHQTIQRELLNDAMPFADAASAQAAVDRWRQEYNHERPHQSLGMATPASRFRPVPAEERAALALVLPAQLRAVTPGADPDMAPDSPYSCPDPRPDRGAPSILEGGLEPSEAVEPTQKAIEAQVVASAEAVEIERMVPRSGNLGVCGQQFWLGEALGGKLVTLRIDTTSVHLTVEGRRVKTVVSRITTADLARLRAGGARPAGPPPAPASAGGVHYGAAIEVDRTVNASGTVSIGGTVVGIGQILGGRRVTLRLDGDVIHVVADGVLAKTIPNPLTPEKRLKVPGARLAGVPPRIHTGPVRVQRTVSHSGAIQVAKQKVQVGLRYARTIVSVEVDERTLKVLNDAGEILKEVPRTTQEEVTRFKAWGSWSRSA